jgi:hypothetical protein
MRLNHQKLNLKKNAGKRNNSQRVFFKKKPRNPSKKLLDTVATEKQLGLLKSLGLKYSKDITMLVARVSPGNTKVGHAIYVIVHHAASTGNPCQSARSMDAHGLCRCIREHGPCDTPMQLTHKHEKENTRHLQNESM